MYILFVLMCVAILLSGHYMYSSTMWNRRRGNFYSQENSYRDLLISWWILLVACIFALLWAFLSKK